MINRILKYFLTLIFLITVWELRTLNSQTPEKPNIIFILLDDLNDYTETLAGHIQVETPAITQLEQLGTTFINAYSNSPKCAPSRTSMIAGKDLKYTQIFENTTCMPFRDYFTAANNNEEVYTLPGYLKDSGGYFTYGINKIYHCFDSYADYDSLTTNPCEKSLSWNKYSLFKDGEDPEITALGNANNNGIRNLGWYAIPDNLESSMYDHKTIDSAIIFMNNVINGEQDICGNPFLLMIGLRKPHIPWYIPEKYFKSYYIDNYYNSPFKIPYNYPENTYPANGIIMPPQPDTLYQDFNNLPENGLGQYLAMYDSCFYALNYEIDKFDPMPEIDPDLSEEKRRSVLDESIRANATIAYLASIKFVDAQIQRLINALETHPELYSNTIIVLVSDNGFSLGEKRHWLKGTMWETDLRVPFIIADLRNPIQQMVNTPVSLLDIFPTICDLTHTPLPVFNNGTLYTDGFSLQPLLENLLINYERPILSSFKDNGTIQCSCFPQYSIRNENFHYIHYTSNNSELLSGCDLTKSFNEEELYEVGANREIDPNEWNNLSANDDYLPIINYLQQWLPDSDFYLQKTFKIIITDDIMECFSSHDDTLQLSFNIYDTSGLQISPPENYDYVWTNNITGDSIFGTTCEFMMNTISNEEFNSTTSIIFFVQMIEPYENIIRAISTKKIDINSINAPSVSFSLINTGNSTAYVNDFLISGSYDNFYWDIGEGPMFFDQIPGAITFNGQGTNTITCFLQYGNSTTCSTSFQNTFIANEDNQIDDHNLFVYPNPAFNLITVVANQTMLGNELYIFNATGNIVKKLLHNNNEPYLEINISDLPQGLYFIRSGSSKESRAGSFIIAANNQF